MSIAPRSRSRAEPTDPVGAETLERLAGASNYNRWLFDRVSRWIGTRVLEIGAGVGNMSAFIADRDRVVLSDADAYYLARLRERFAGRPNIAVTALELPTTNAALVAERFDTIICLNVLEHVEDDRASLAAMHRLLHPGGRLVLLVPALQGIYGTLDAALGHVRRYDRAELAGKFKETGFRLRHLEYFNLAGIPGWWFAGRVMKRRLIPAGSLRWYDVLVPLFRLEALLPWRVGQSLIAIGDVPATSP